jgi:diacylglycerol kinase family enzyme
MFIISRDLAANSQEIDRFISLAETVFLKIGLPEPIIHISRFPRDALAVIRSFKEEYPDTVTRIYAVGGDSILFDCLNAVIGLKGIELASVPWGQEPGFISSFGDGRAQLFRDLELQATSQVILTDVLQCGPVYALNVCTVGLESYAAFLSGRFSERLKNVTRHLPESLDRALHKALFFFGEMATIANSTLLNQKYDLLIDGEVYSGSYCCLNISNGPCSRENKQAAICAVPDDGLLDVVLMKSCSPARIFSMFGSYVRGRYHRYPKYITYLKAREVSISSGDPLVLQLDGEVFADTSLTVRIVPAAVSFVSAGNLPYHRRAVLAQPFL